MSEKHTPGPFAISDLTATVLRICAPKGGEIAVIYDAPKPGMQGDREAIHSARLEQLGNAEFIVRACNAHDELVKALKAARSNIETYGAANDDVDGAKLTPQAAEAVARINAAIRKATGEQQ